MKNIDVIKNMYSYDKTVKVTERVPRKIKSKLKKHYRADIIDIIAFKLYRKPWDFYCKIK